MLFCITRRAAIAAIMLSALPGGAAAQQAPGSAQRQAGDTLVVFAAASLKNVLDATGQQWLADTGRKATFSYAASSALAKQIEQGAPADVFASADLKWMDYAQEKGLIDAASRISLLGNKLVLIAPRDFKTDLKIEKGFKFAEAIGDSRVATGDPKAVPAGIYAKAALTSLGVWDAVAPKIAGTDNVRSALALVARGEAHYGIVYETDAKSEPLVKIVDTFPAGSHPAVVYPFAVTTSSKNVAARDFLAYLRSNAAKSIFVKGGFTVLP